MYVGYITSDQKLSLLYTYRLYLPWLYLILKLANKALPLSPCVQSVSQLSDIWDMVLKKLSANSGFRIIF